MMRATLFSTFAAALMAWSVASGGDAKPDSVEADKAKLQGRWVITHAGMGGFPIHPTKNKKGKTIGGDYPDFIFDGDKFTFVDRGDKEDPEWTKFKIDPSKNPKHLEVFGKDGKEVFHLGIYKFEGDTLTISWTGTKERPTGFNIMQQPKNTHLFIMVRQAPQK